MFQELKFIFEKNAWIERYETFDKFYACKMEENGSVSEHILRMSGYHNHLTQLGVFFLMIVSLTEFFSHCHQATRAS